jgi:hypothetical protein
MNGLCVVICPPVDKGSLCPWSMIAEALLPRHWNKLLFTGEICLRERKNPFRIKKKETAGS